MASGTSSDERGGGRPNPPTPPSLRACERAICTHCYGHALNLAVADVVKQNKVIRDVLDTVGEINKLLKYSPRRDSLFEQLKSSVSPGTVGFRTRCPTQWTVRAASLQSVIDNPGILG